MTYQIGVIEALAFPDTTIDVVLSSLMMHHLPDDLKREGLLKIARVLKPGGRLLIVDMRRVLVSLAMHGHMESGIQDLPPLLGAAGFMDLELGGTGFRLLGFVRADSSVMRQREGDSRLGCSASSPGSATSGCAT